MPYSTRKITYINLYILSVELRRIRIAPHPLLPPCRGLRCSIGNCDILFPTSEYVRIDFALEHYPDAGSITIHFRRFGNDLLDEAQAAFVEGTT